ncbi:MAG TPA: POTRA domain-containing protein [Terriglobales bacterium]
MRRLLFLFLFLAARAVQAQQNVPNAGAMYEGEIVTAVDIVTDPHIDVGPLEAMVVQKTGKPYSQKDVDASVTALQATKQFRKVNTIETPEEKGLQLSFVLEPAYYVGIVDFPEAEKRFSYVRLLQVVNYSDENPYDKSFTPVAETALQNFLKANGYFRATVRSETRVDDQNQLVDISFHADMGARARIGTVKIEGPPEPEAAVLIHSVQSLRARFTGGFLKPGKAYSPGRMKDAIDLIKKKLAKQHYLAAKVKPLPLEYHADTNLVDVAIHIDPGPVILVQTVGARLSVLPFVSHQEEKKNVPIYSEGTIDRDLVDEGQQNLVDYFQKKGYFDIQVKTEFEHKADQYSLTYVIDKGKKHKVAQIILQGNTALSRSDLLDHIPVKKSHVWTHGSYSQKLLKTSEENIQALYHDTGYEDVKVTAQVVDREPLLDITFNIVEGPRTLVSDVTITGDETVPYNILAGKTGFQLRAGAPFSPGKLASDRNQITAAYLDNGYLNADVKTTVNRHVDDHNKVDIVFAVTENQLVRISQVLYEGQKRTRLSLLSKTAAINVEAPLSTKQLLESQTRLYDLDVFDWTSVTPKKPITDQTEEETTVKVHEAKRTEIIYGFGFEVSKRGGNVPVGSVAVPGLPPVNIGNNQVAPSEATYASPRGSIEFVRHNMRGLAETASFSLLASRLDQKALASYAFPDFQQTRWNALTTLSYERTTENPLFAANLADVAFQVERVLNKKTNTRLQFRYDFNHTALSELLVPELVLPQDRNVRLSTVSTALIRDTRDKPLDAHKGSYETVNLSITPTALGSSANFVKLFAQYAVYKPVHGMVWASSLRLGLASAFAGSFVPTSELFFAGGGTTIRGFPLYSAGPQRIVPFCNVLVGNAGCVNITVPVGGRQLAIVNTELRFPLKIMPNLGAVIFYDGGNVYSAINFNQFVSNYTNTVGVGLRYTTPIGPIRLDIGRNLNPVPGIGATQYFITLGQAF